MDMNPGRELDALIAEKVMGLDPVNFNRDQNYHEILSDGPALLPYSTGIAAAWEVVEKIRLMPWSEQYADSPGIDIRLTWCHKRETWECRAQNEAFVMESAATAPHAICLAALKAVGES